jgi:hypothetical protein
VVSSESHGKAERNCTQSASSSPVARNCRCKHQALPFVASVSSVMRSVEVERSRQALGGNFKDHPVSWMQGQKLGRNDQ